MIPPGKRHSVRLCATFVRTANVPGRYGDGYGGLGLSLLVTPRKSGGLSKTWAQAVSPNGTKTSLGLGSWPVVTPSPAGVVTGAMRFRRTRALVGATTRVARASAGVGEALVAGGRFEESQAVEGRQ